MPGDYVERPQLTYFKPGPPSSDLSEQDVVDLQGLLYLELTPIISWLESDGEDRDYTLLGDYIRIAEDVLEGWGQLYGSMPRNRFTQVYIMLEKLYKELAACQDFLVEKAAASIAPGRLPPVPGLRGAPRLDIDVVQLTSLLCIRDMTYAQIGGLAGCSGKTVQRRAKEMGVNRRKFSEITQEELDRAVIAAYLRGSGDQGYRAIHTYLELEGIKVTRDQVQATCRRLNPDGTWDRWIRARLRRVYRVPWVNSLWHIDGHHKLNPWKIVIHGGIDGFSRRIVFLQASNNNLAVTVEDCFMHATRCYGWPSRVRVDYGGENLGVKKRLEEVRGTVDSKGPPEEGDAVLQPQRRTRTARAELARSRVTRDRPVGHAPTEDRRGPEVPTCGTRPGIIGRGSGCYPTQYPLVGTLPTGCDRRTSGDVRLRRGARIERLWVDLQRTCTSRYRTVFIHLENIGLLSPDNDLDLWALHYVYLPVINEALRCFARYWDMHRIRTAGNQSPAKMWAMNEAKARKVGVEPVRYLEDLHGEQDKDISNLPDDQTQQFFEDYGVDDYGRRPTARVRRKDPHVEFPSPDEVNPISHRELLNDPVFLQALAASVGPLWPVDDTCAVPQYLTCREMVYARLGLQPPRPEWWNH
ncbi:hypothetical protein A1Q1_04033 [Trichosporon asahii var. asahii CBS 2479]|uniref:Integrase core domain-containing protein n=1 Tax=Trichosporon asahii var. asahii (strain ATCC 90039 / CBS 2479 / JCM 2466 / KCTC 7840 / NBRC 103889/ NCYC 2677 / UAMH 7654) TaxID=1186058 RepID=J4U987_TRIAS|nr:hypothetical protein A1Q1_04033 [Trichosporon asahii var. asahii CBS 2479]EJT47175.1 hypothetical protein A1Q1_04033 [Trichosporon asahii var. asahii CBS 2479]